MKLNLPKSLELHEERLREFFQGMLMKLDKNSHKKTPETHDIPGMIRLMMGELDEFKYQFKFDKTDANAAVELFDIANFAYLMFLALRNQGTADWRNVGRDD